MTKTKTLHLNYIIYKNLKPETCNRLCRFARRRNLKPTSFTPTPPSHEVTKSSLSVHTIFCQNPQYVSVHDH